MRSRFNTVYVTKESKLTGDEFFVGVSVGVSVGVLVIRANLYQPLSISIRRNLTNRKFVRVAPCPFVSEERSEEQSECNEGSVVRGSVKSCRNEGSVVRVGRKI